MNLECDILGKYVARAVELAGRALATVAIARVDVMTPDEAPGASRRSRPSTRPISAIRDGEMIIVVDDEDRENEGDLTIAAEKITPEAINFMATHGRGLICMPMTEERLDELDHAADGREEHRAVRHGVLRVDRGEGRDQHRHLGRRSRGDRAGRHRSAHAARRISRGRATCFR